MDCITRMSSFLKRLSGNYYDFGCDSLVSGSFSQQAFEVLGVFLLFGFGLKVLNFSWFCKPVNFLFCDSVVRSGPLRNGISSKNDFGSKCSSKISSCDSSSHDEDKVFDVLSLRNLIKIERERANSALSELEKERMSAAIAAEESMAMILRLQNEKSLIEMESNHYRRLAEEKMVYDEELIQSLEWLVMKYESEITLGDHLEMSQTKLKRLRMSISSEVVEDDSFRTCHANIEAAVC